MTRINVVPPAELHSKHLVAEYRELPRVFALVRAAHERGERPGTINAPARYTLGRGHVKFFYDKLGWLTRRQKALIDEMIARGYKPTFLTPEDLSRDIDRVWLNEWTPDVEALMLNRQRIEERSPWKST
ncbi:MAG: endonuclease V [Phenylobacterium zucineum]|nr:MAG: endonuclease V [Phenylobacterium zucineum]